MLVLGRRTVVTASRSHQLVHIRHPAHCAAAVCLHVLTSPLFIIHDITTITHLLTIFLVQHPSARLEHLWHITLSVFIESPAGDQSMFVNSAGVFFSCVYEYGGVFVCCWDFTLAIHVEAKAFQG